MDANGINKTTFTFIFDMHAKKGQLKCGEKCVRNIFYNIRLYVVKLACVVVKMGHFLEK